MVKDGAVHPSPCVRASSFSNPPVHRRHFSAFQEGSGVSNRLEDLALLTTIVEGGGNCNPVSDPLPNQFLLSTSLINKILRLIVDALDLPCQRSYIALDQLLLDALEALKIAYPKCLSGLSANQATINVLIIHKKHPCLALLVQKRKKKNILVRACSEKHVNFLNFSVIS